MSWLSQFSVRAIGFHANTDNLRQSLFILKGARETGVGSVGAGLAAVRGLEGFLDCLANLLLLFVPVGIGDVTQKIHGRAHVVGR